MPKKPLRIGISGDAQDANSVGKMLTDEGVALIQTAALYQSTIGTIDVLEMLDAVIEGLSNVRRDLKKTYMPHTKKGE